MGKYVVLASSVVLALWAPHVWASDWIWIAEGSDQNMQLFADNDSISSDGAHNQVWMERKYRKPVKLDPKDPAVAAIKDRWKFDCKERTGSSVSSISYSKDGRVISSRGESLDGMRSVAPDSILERGYTFACDLKARDEMVSMHRQMQRDESGNNGQSLSEFLRNMPKREANP